MEGVEDIPGTALTEGIEWEWETFDGYLDALDRREYVLDIGTQVPHGALRAYVMGDRGAANEPATAADIAAMAAMVADGLRAGALGFSTSRTPLHKSKSGELVPGTMVDAEELYGIADAMAEVGHGVFQFAPEHILLPNDEWPWMRELARRSGRTVSVNFSQTDQAPDLWKQVLANLDDDLAAGIPIVAQVHGRTVGLLMCLDGSYHPLMFHPAFQEIAALPLAERCAALASGPIRDRIVHEVPDDGGFFERAVLGALGKTWAVADGDIDYEPEPPTSIAARAERDGTPPMQLVIDQLLTADGHGMLYSPFFNYSYGDLSFNYAAHLHPGTRMGLADAGAHVRVICDGGTPTFMLTHWTRDRTRGPKLPLEYVIHRQTRQTAELYGLGDRGLARARDASRRQRDRLRRRSRSAQPRMAWDLPGGAPRLVQKATRLSPHAGRRRRDGDRRRVHRRAARPTAPRATLTAATDGQPAGTSGGSATLGSRRQSSQLALARTRRNAGSITAKSAASSGDLSTCSTRYSHALGTLAPHGCPRARCRVRRARSGTGSGTGTPRRGRRRAARCGSGPRSPRRRGCRR